MKLLGKVLILFAFILSVALAGLIYVYLKDQEKPEQVIEKVEVLVVRETIEPRKKILEEQLTWVALTKDAVPDGIALKLEDVVGLYSKDTLYANEPIRLERLVQDPNVELTMRLKPGFRAMSIGMTLESGVSNLVKVGDYVDFLVFLPEIRDSNRIVRPNIEKMIYQNIEVLAIGRQLLRESQSGSEDDVQSDRYQVTLAVPVNDVEGLALAEDIGELKMVLRPLEQDFIYPTNGAIWEDLMLNDSYQIKDFFPSYDVDVAENSSLTLESGEIIEKYIYYTVKPGDTLRKISTDFFGDDARYLLLKEINGIEDENFILTGTGIKIPVFKQ